MFRKSHLKCLDVYGRSAILYWDMLKGSFTLKSDRQWQIFSKVSNHKLQTKSVNLAWIVTGNLYYNIIDKTFRVLQKVKSYIYGWFQYVFIGTNTHLSIIIPKNDYFLKKYEIKCISTRPLCYVLSVTSF